MSKSAIKPTFRQTFKTVEKELLRWFPGHMNKGLKQMQQKLKLVDCIIEVHDARIPISGRNTDFKYTVSGLKPHILVLNKKDLIEKSKIPIIENHLKQQKLQTNHVFFTNCKDHRDNSVKKILPFAENLILNNERFNRTNSNEYNLMIIGVPNVGKSSLINSLRNYHLKKANASQVGATPGITRSVLNRIKISENPPVYLYDTPGILTPNVQNIEAGLKLALCGTLQDHSVGEILIADYLLFWLNKNMKFNYVKHFELDNPTDDIVQILILIANKLNKTKKVKIEGNYYIRPDIDFAAQLMIKSFRSGDLGKIMLDQDVIQL